MQDPIIRAEITELRDSGAETELKQRLRQRMASNSAPLVCVGWRQGFIA